MAELKIGVLALQGDFAEHEQILSLLGAQCIEIRQRRDLEEEIDGLILPGGESTVMGKLLNELDIFMPIKEKISTGLPVLGTCAGLILLAKNLSNDDKSYFATLPVTVKRNAYGKQLGSFECQEQVKGVGVIKMSFIRAPYIEKCSEDVEILAKVKGNIVGVKYGNQIGLSFHPEVTDDTRIHRYFLSLCEAEKSSND